MSSKDDVDLVASGYDWECPKCEYENLVIGVPIVGTAIGEVKCLKCKTIFDVGCYYHHFDD
jgi:hypothetical protein